MIKELTGLSGLRLRLAFADVNFSCKAGNQKLFFASRHPAFVAKSNIHKQHYYYDSQKPFTPDISLR
ncbi:hypothetical protein RB2501_12122 [Robiginitalea biformata HTCC2501]|uniref:Uncharacterized protein n=1 Tax=Robiginitalea biformata (strain ATCC BAA-864 / DSM 15991 / KCTC 12146 / HTCC2501) TaxID=313596 RepID=A4CN31_ROBBH|nr:hypothetical protein RB2501_12122 [Robiginitalea biformata HTCC2501]